MSRFGRFRGLGLNVASPIAVVVIWQITSTSGLLDQRFWPPPSSVAVALYNALVGGSLLDDVLITTQRLLVGIAIGGTAGLVAGLGMGLWKPVNIAIRPLIAMTYPIPKIAILPLFLLVFGLGEESKWAVVSVGVFYLVAVNTYVGVRNVEEVYRETAEVYRVSWWKKVRTVALPGALPLILAGFELGIGVGFLLIVATEFVTSRSGLGFRIWLAWQTFDIRLMYAGLAVIALYGFAILGLSRFLERRLVPWRRLDEW